jgi:hypothetical protein
LKPTVPNAKWAVKVGSQSYGNVVVAGGKVFIGTNNENPRDPQHQGDRSILMCFDEKTGAFPLAIGRPQTGLRQSQRLGKPRPALLSLRRGQPRLYRHQPLRSHVPDTEGMANGNQGPFMDEAQYVAGPGNPPAKIGPHDADIIWKYDMMDELGVFPHNASNCSLLIVGDLIYACTSNGQDWTHVNIPSPNSPSLIAINKITGKLAGEDNAGIGPRIFHGQWSSPSMGVVNGRTLIFFGGGDGICYAFDAEPQKGDGSPIVRSCPARRSTASKTPTPCISRKSGGTIAIRRNAAPTTPPTNIPRRRPQRSQRHARLLAQPRLCGRRPGPGTRRRRRHPQLY